MAKTEKRHGNGVFEALVCFKTFNYPVTRGKQINLDGLNGFSAK